MAKDNIIKRSRARAEGSLNRSDAVARMRATGVSAAQWKALFQTLCRKNQLHQGTPAMSFASFRKLMPGQGELF